MTSIRNAFYLMSLFFAANAWSQPVNINEQGIAVHGYDVTSYFKAEPVLGNDDFVAKHNGATYLFANEANRNQFNENPAAFLPQYGGYCAFGVRMGKKFDIKFNAYEIVDGKLFLMLDRSTHHLWLKEKQENIKIAERLWPAIKHVPIKELE
jgi:YHS domain-containing protein